MSWNLVVNARFMMRKSDPNESLFYSDITWVLWLTIRSGSKLNWSIRLGWFQCSSNDQGSSSQDLT